MDTQHCAGGVVIKKTNGTWMILLILDKYGKWTFPKGHLDPGESDLEAARREITEETGVTDLKFMRNLPDVRYSFVSNGTTINKTVTYYLFQTDSDNAATPMSREEIPDVRWFTLGEALSVLGYPLTYAPFFETVTKILTTL